MIVHIVNRSTLVADADGQAATAAIQRQLVEDFEPAWGVSAVLHYVAAGAQPPPGAWQIQLVDQITVDGALGYHEDEGTPGGFVGVKTCQDDGVDWRACLSHEILEMVGDAWATVAIESGGKFYALEVCDPVEGHGPSRGYLRDGVPLEPFVLPAYFRPGAPGPYDNLGILSKPLELAEGGYQLVNDGGQWSQVNAEHVRAGKRVITLGSRRHRRASR